MDCYDQRYRGGVPANLVELTRRFSDAVSKLSSSVFELAAHLEQRGVDVSRITEALGDAERVVMDELDIAGNMRHDYHHVTKTERHNKLQRTRLHKLERELEQARGNTLTDGHLHNVWRVRVGLSCPRKPARSLRRELADHLILSAGTKVRGNYVSVEQTRAAFTEMYKYFSASLLRKTVRSAVEGLEGQQQPKVYLGHVHDEVSYRLVSRKAPDAGEDYGVHRQLHSKCQMDACEVHIGDEHVSWPSEFRAMAKKDGYTIASCIIFLVVDILHAVAQGVEEAGRRQADPVKLIHLCTGDAVNTNENVLKRLLYYFLRIVGLIYRLIAFKCWAHQSNLVVHVAVCDGVVAKPDKNCPLACNLTRIFKYLIPSHASDYETNLARQVVSKLKFEEGPRDPTQSWLAPLQALYGKHVVPDDLVAILNSPTPWTCRPRDMSKQLDVTRRLIRLLVVLLLRNDEHPVVTRFFTFTPCVNRVTLMKILDLDEDLFSSGTEDDANAGRVKNFCKWHSDPGTNLMLRRASLSLQVIMKATSIASHKTNPNGIGDAAVPMMVRLGQGEVQKAVVEELKRVLPLLSLDPVLDGNVVIPSMLETTIHELARFAGVHRAPNNIWKLSAKWNGSAAVTAAEDFLTCAQDHPSSYGHYLHDHLNCCFEMLEIFSLVN